MKIFWAWQSDLPGKVSRFFVRDALLAAIEKLKEPSDIEEPSEEARRNDMHLDSDRQGLSGSPVQIPVHRGQSFRRIADSVPVIADSFR